MSLTPVLGLPDFSKPFIIETNTSNTSVGAVLMQQGRPLSYFSKSLGQKNAGLSTYERELLTIVLAVQKWKLLTRKSFYCSHRPKKHKILYGSENVHNVAAKMGYQTPRV